MSALCDLVAWYESLTADSVAALERHYTPDAYFRDPFNEVRDVASIRAIFDRMFESLHDPRFVVTNRITGDGQAMLEWDFTFRVRRYRPRHRWWIHGVSHLRFAPDGRVNYHRDYWDAAEQLYAKLPLIGPAVRFVQRRLG